MTYISYPFFKQNDLKKTFFAVIEEIILEFPGTCPAHIVLFKVSIEDTEQRLNKLTIMTPDDVIANFEQMLQIVFTHPVLTLDNEIPLVGPSRVINAC